MVQNKIFEANHIRLIELSFTYDYDIGYTFYYQFVDRDGERTSKHDNKNESIKNLEKAFIKMNGFSKENINVDFKEDTSVRVELDKSASEKLLELSLSKELKSILNYNKLSNNLSTKEESSKRPKL